MDFSMAQPSRFPGIFLDGEAPNTRAPRSTATARHVPNRESIYDSEFMFKAALHKSCAKQGPAYDQAWVRDFVSKLKIA
jgi:hypothetical protein